MSRWAAGLLVALPVQAAALLGPCVLIERQIPAEPAVLAALALVSSFCAVEAWCARDLRPVGRDGPMRWLPGLTGLTLLVVFQVALLTRGAGSAWGAALVLGGIAARAAAIRSLGRHFVSDLCLLPGHRLHRGGPYAHLRHPSELGLALIASGVALLLGSAWAAAPGAPLALLLLVRIRSEDAMLARAFPGEFTVWAAAVPALIPRLRPWVRVGVGARS